MGLVLLLLLVAVPLVEVAIFIEVGDVVGLWPTLALIVATAAGGLVLMRMQGFAVLARIRDRLDRGEPPVLEALGALLLLFAGILLLVPGFFTDAVGFLLLVPPVRAMVAGLLLAVAERRRARAAGPGAADPREGAGGRGGGRRRDDGSQVIDGDYHVVDDEVPPSGRIGRRPDTPGDGSPWRRR